MNSQDKEVLVPHSKDAWGKGVLRAETAKSPTRLVLIRPLAPGRGRKSQLTQLYE